MTITYGLPQPTDLDAVLTVESACFEDELQLSRDEIQVNLAKNRKNWMVARDDQGHIVGIMIGTPVSNEHLSNDDYVAADLKGEESPYFAILSLAVLPAYQGKGIAGQLIRRALLLAKLTDHKAVVLDCEKRLIPYYEAHQFKQNGRSNSTFGGVEWFSMIHPI